MIRLSRLSDYAVVLMTEMSRRSADQPLVSGAALSAACNVPEPTVAKILKALSKAGLVGAARGAAGGYRLGRAAEDISIADIITAIDGPIALTSCVTDGDGCVAEGFCSMRGNWEEINAAVRAALAGVSLARMAVPSWSQRTTATPVHLIGAAE